MIAVILGVGSPNLWPAPGDLFVSNDTNDEGGDSIVRFTVGAVRSTFAGISRPTGIAFDQTGNLFVAARTLSGGNPAGTILKVSPDGTQSIFAAAGSNPQGLVFDSMKNLYLSDTDCGCVTRYAADGAVTAYASGLDHPFGMVFDRDGNLYVATGTGDILKITPEGARTTFASGLSAPIALASNGSSVLAGNSDGKIYVFSIFDGSRSVVASGLPAPPLGLALSPTSDLFITLNNGSIWRLQSTSATATPFVSGLGSAPFLATEPAKPGIDSLGRRSSGKVIIHGHGVINAANRLQASATLDPADFFTIKVITTGASGTFVTEDIAGTARARFYRLVYP